MKLFAATTETPANSIAEVVRLNLSGNLAGTQTLIGIVTACAGQPGNICSTNAPLAAGNNTVEIDWDQGAGSLKVWVNNNVEASPDVNIAANNADWGGVDFAVLGLSTPQPGFRTNHLNQIINFDRFDSRRQTFIGF